MRVNRADLDVVEDVLPNVTSTKNSLLFLSPRVPWPLNTGAKIRTRALLDALTREFAVDYAGFLQPDLPRDEALRSLAGCAEVFLAPEPATSLVGKATLVLGNVVDWRPATLAKYDDGDLRRHAVQWMGRHPGAIVHADHLHMAG